MKTNQIPWVALIVALFALLGCSESGNSVQQAPVCASPQLACDGMCVDTRFDANNCGGCGSLCAAPNSCTLGWCAPCPVSGQFSCNGTCIDVLSDPNNCGNCGLACGAGQSCSQGVCTGISTEPGAGPTGPTGPGGITCAQGMACGLSCVNTLADNANCGGCGIKCGTGSSCSNGTCECTTGTGCPGADGTVSCVNTQADGQNCGVCGTACGAGSVCQNGMCMAGGCTGSTMECNGGCVDINTDTSNCGQCGVACDGGEVCEFGACKCQGGSAFVNCSGVCIDTDNDSANCGGCGTQCPIGQVCSAGGCVDPSMVPAPTGPTPTGPMPSGTGPVDPGPAPTGGMVTPDGRTCPVAENVIADFEEGNGSLPMVQGRAGAFEGYGHENGTRTDTFVEEGTEECNKYVFHTKGSGFGASADDGYSGVGTVFAGVEDATLNDGEGGWVPEVYDAAALGYAGIAFRAKAGPEQSSPVRFSISTPWTEGEPDGDGSCENAWEVEGTNKPCWNHLGHFMLDKEELGSDWKTYTFCFDRDLHPSWLPSGVVTGQRKAVAQNLYKLQFQFNQAMDPSTFESDAFKTYSHLGSFDFYIDDIRFVTAADCPAMDYESSAGTADAFGTNEAIGTCPLIAGAEGYNAQIAEAYERWKTLFVANDGGVIDPQEGNRVVSEGIGYGMLIAAAMGDKATFDKIWGWAKPKLGSGNGLLGWNNGGGGSAADADTDIAYALLMADKQWGGGSYAADGNTMASQALSQDVVDNVIRGGQMFKDPLNPSYFSPGFYRAFSGWGSVITASANAVRTCQSSWGGLLPDWCSGGSWSPSTSPGQQNANELCEAGNPCMAMDAARIGWRLGFDACLGGDTTILKAYIDAIKSKGSIDNGARVDLLKTGWNSNGPVSSAVDFTIAFIGPVGVGAMGLKDSVTYERAFHTVLDVIERPEYYRTYYQSSVGMLSLLMMSGNWPTVPAQ